MALKHLTRTLGVDKITLFPITADDSSSYTCGTGIDVPGAKEINLTYEFIEAEFENGLNIEEIYQRAKKVAFSFNFSKLDLDLNALVAGGDVEDSGLTPDQKTTYSFGVNDKGGYFQLQAQIEEQENDGGDVVIALMKCKGKVGDVASKEGEFSSFSISGSAIPTINTFTRNTKDKNLIQDIIFRETTAALAAITS